jgi:hypothetical protein
MSAARICIVPRWGGSADDDWYAWIRRELRDYHVELAPLRPQPSAPTIEACVASIAETCGRDPDELSRTVLIGHSVGAQAALRFVESLAPPLRVRGVLCVAGWFWVDDPWETIRPWIDTPMDRTRVREAAGRIEALIGDDDPFTRDHEANAHRWRTALGAKASVIPGAKHLNRAREPAVLDAVRSLIE